MKIPSILAVRYAISIGKESRPGENCCCCWKSTTAKAEALTNKFGPSMLTGLEMSQATVSTLRARKAVHQQQHGSCHHSAGCRPQHSLPGRAMHPQSMRATALQLLLSATAMVISVFWYHRDKDTRNEERDKHSQKRRPGSSHVLLEC